MSWFPSTDPPQGHAGEPWHLPLLSDAVKAEVIPRLLRSYDRPRPDGDAAAAGAPRLDAQVVRDLAHLVLLPEDSLCRAATQALRRQGIPVLELYAGLLAPAARQLGVWWEEDLCTFSDVTLGVARLQQLMRELAVWLPPPPAVPVGRILLATAPGEQHGFGMVMLAEFFRTEGWEVEGGPSCPDPAARVRGAWFDVVAFSVAGNGRVAPLKKLIAAVRRASRNPGVGIMAGGPLLALRPGLGGEVGADAVSGDAWEALEVAARLSAPRPRPA